MSGWFPLENGAGVTPAKDRSGAAANFRRSHSPKQAKIQTVISRPFISIG
jgi:hypothetical protein